MNPEMKAMLEALAARKCWLDDEDFNAMDFSGGNFDDAFSGGRDAGEITLARALLATFARGEQP